MSSLLGRRWNDRKDFYIPVYVWKNEISIPSEYKVLFFLQFLITPDDVIQCVQYNMRTDYQFTG